MPICVRKSTAERLKGNDIRLDCIGVLEISESVNYPRINAGVPLPKYYGQVVEKRQQYGVDPIYFESVRYRAATYY